MTGTPLSSTTTPARTAYLVASGDLRESANLAGWPTQAAMETALREVFTSLDWTLVRAHPEDPGTGHGFISSQRAGLDVFAGIPAEAPVVVAESVWQYSHHVLGGLGAHRGPILTVANFVGDRPGLVGLLGLNACLTKIGRDYSTAWSVDFTDAGFRDRIAEWLDTGAIALDDAHVHELPALRGSAERDLGRELAAELLHRKSVIGVFDEGCMGMMNAIVEDHLMNPLGIFKERLSQSALYAEMLRVTPGEAAAVIDWVRARGMRFVLGADEATELTEGQLLDQARMYIAALRIADDFGVDAIGIQYQQGLKDLAPASDLAEGLLNNVDRPPVRSRDGSRVLWEGTALPCFNESDEGVGIDALVTHRLWTSLGWDPATTLHDVRWGEDYDGEFVWVLEISGAVPPSHFARGYADAEGRRQDPVYFPLGGSTIRGFSKPGEVVWSRIFIMDGVLHADLGLASAIELPEAEAERRSAATNPEWPIMHAVIHGVSRDQFMGRHRANHLNVAYAPTRADAERAIVAKAAFLDALGIQVHLIGDAVQAAR